MANIYYRLYNTASVIDFELYEPDGTDLEVAAAHAAGDTTISIDEGAFGNTTNGFVDEGSTYSLTLTAAELTGQRMIIVVMDQTSPKVWLDKVLIVETYGDTGSGAQHEKL